MSVGYDASGVSCDSDAGETSFASKVGEIRLP